MAMSDYIDHKLINSCFCTCLVKIEPKLLRNVVSVKSLEFQLLSFKLDVAQNDGNSTFRTGSRNIAIFLHASNAK